MIIKNLKVRHYRGIESLDWAVAGRFVCLIGAGDSTKSTILNSVELVLTPRWNVSFDDADFYDADTDDPIIIEITVGEVPPLSASRCQVWVPHKRLASRNWDHR